MNRAYFMMKRMIDVILAGAGVLLISPILLVIALWIKADSAGPILFRQQRVGRHGRLFWIYKFRTMVHAGSGNQKLLTIGRDPRITRSGAILRKYKLDELPQLFNVLKGEMSLVGPRPEVPYYVRYYTDSQRKVLQVKPGITDWASIKYKDESLLLDQADEPEDTYIKHIMPDKLQLNLRYINEASIFKDIQIILQTMLKICK
ncbi:sugar transferase [Brevibacillus fluminis]|uniref:sugar transferase n=1 Tax=Brevibacillus fluminis TaxID=511487 RepID=UPI003F8B1D66